MNETWSVVVNAAGEAVSIGTRVADPLPPGLTARVLSADEAAAVTTGRWRWDAASQSVMALQPPVPDAVEPWQLALWLLRHRGVRIAQVESLIDAIPDEVAREEARISWKMQRPIPRSAALVVQFARSLGLDEPAVDDAFRQAATI